MERDQIWAEAVARFRTGEPLYLTGTTLQEAEKEQAARLIIDPWESIINEYLSRKIPIDWFDRSIEEQKNYWVFHDENSNIELIERDRICTGELLTVCLGIEAKRQSSIDRKRVLDILKKCRTLSFRKNIRFGKSYGVTSGFVGFENVGQGVG